MNKKFKTILFALLSFFFLTSFNSSTPLNKAATTNDDLLPVTLHFFYSDSCSSCASLDKFLNEKKEEYDNITIVKYLTDNDVDNLDYEQNTNLLLSVSEILIDKVTNEVPFLAMGGRGFLGFNKTVEYEIKYFIEKYSNFEHVDVVSKIKNGEQVNEGDIDRTELDLIELPLIGVIDPKTISLGLVAVVLGLVDGFNPCAMWVLLFLITLLLPTQDRKRIFILGGIFLLTSALFYFALMMTWISAVSLVAANKVFRIIVGAFAIAAGGYNLYKFIKALVKKEEGCEVTDEKQKNKLIERVKKIVNEQKMIIAILGIIALAIIVNFIELACSAGLPIVFSNILAINGISGGASIGYVLLYVLFFMIDDIVVFLIVMFTLKLKVISNKITKYNHLIGAVIMILIGVLMIFFPSILQFSFLSVSLL